MGLIVDIYRSDYDSELNVFFGKKSVTLVNVEGPFEPTEDRPAAKLDENALGNPIILPADFDPDTVDPKGLLMDGGTYGSTSDARLREALGKKGFYGAIPIHDRFETWDLYERMSV